MKIGPFEINRAEKRATLYPGGIENPKNPLTPEVYEAFQNSLVSRAGVNVTPEVALGVPSFSSGATFISNTIAKLPLHVVKRKRVNGHATQEVETGTALARLVGEQVNDTTSSFGWRKNGMLQKVFFGRWLTYIERNEAGTPINLIPLDVGVTTIEITDGVKTYVYEPPGERRRTYTERDVLDIPWLMKPDMLNAVGPYQILRETIGRAVAIADYSASFFRNGGMPPLSLEGEFETGGGVQRASEDITQTLQTIAKAGNPILPLPANHKLIKIGFEPEKGQMVEVERHLIQEMARGFNLPPMFLQDLSQGTFSNTEQQDLHLVKHALTNIIENIEAELNLKLFRRGANTRHIEFNLDAILRGDFKERMEGWARGIQGGVFMPSEAREREGLPFADGTDQVFIQGANVPVDQAGKPNGATPPK